MMKDSQAFWDRVSRGSGGSAGQVDRSELSTIELAKRHLKSQDQVLDFGCGTGTMTCELAAGVQRILAIDSSSGMIEKAKKTAEERSVGNIIFRQATIFEKDLHEQSFDAVLAFSILHLIEDIGPVLARICRLLKPGGLFISVTVCLGNQTGFLAWVLMLLSRIGLIPRLNRLSPDELERAMSDIGFTVIEIGQLGTKPPSHQIIARKQV